MTPASKLVYDFNRKYNLSKRGDNVNLFLVDIIGYLNEAQDVWFGKMAERYEVTNFAASELREFEEKNVSLAQVSSGDSQTVFALPSNMYKRLNQKAQVKSPNCCGDLVKTIPVSITSSDKINEVLQNPFYKPSFPWEQLPGNEASNKFYVYSGDMDVISLTIDYLRKPNEIHAPSLIQGNCSPQQYRDYAGREIVEDTFFEPTARFADRKVVDIALLLAKGDRGDYQAFEKQIKAIIFGEN